MRSTLPNILHHTWRLYKLALVRMLRSLFESKEPGPSVVLPNRNLVFVWHETQWKGKNQKAREQNLSIANYCWWKRGLLMDDDIHGYLALLCNKQSSLFKGWRRKIKRTPSHKNKQSNKPSLSCTFNTLNAQGEGTTVASSTASMISNNSNTTRSCVKTLHNIQLRTTTTTTATNSNDFSSMNDATCCIKRKRRSRPHVRLLLVMLLSILSPWLCTMTEALEAFSSASSSSASAFDDSANNNDDEVLIQEQRLLQLTNETMTNETLTDETLTNETMANETMAPNATLFPLWNDTVSSLFVVVVCWVFVLRNFSPWVLKVLLLLLLRLQHHMSKRCMCSCCRCCCCCCFVRSKPHGFTPPTGSHTRALDTIASRRTL